MKRIKMLAICGLVLCGSCALITPRALRQGWQWDGVLRVMPNSMFEPLTKAREAAPMSANSGPLPAVSMHEEKPLTGIWKYQPDADLKGEDQKWFASEFDDSGWKEMKVPNNYTIDDPALKNFYGPVWFRRSFQLPQSFNGKNLRLNFEGVDYFAKVWLNGELLGEHEGYFNPFTFDISKKIKPDMNVLVVAVTNPWDYSMEQSEALWVHMAEKIWPKGIFTYHDSRMGGIDNSAKDAQSYGTGGIYRPVKIVATGAAAIDWVLISPKLFDNYTKAEVGFEVFVTNFTGQRQDALISIETAGENFSGYQDSLSAKVILAPGANKVRLTLPVQDPKLWWPYSHPELGRPSLYRANVKVVLNSTVSDDSSHLFGLKEVKLEENGPEPFIWHVNGKRMFFRGTNGIPTQYYSKLTPEYLDDYFKLLKDSGFELLIVHDHQAPPMVYEQADREGVVLLQNFTLIWEISVCDFARPNGDPKLTNNVEVITRMSTEAMWYLYNHPSLFWWSMHDESNLIAFNGKGLANGSFCKQEPYQQGDFMPVFVDMDMNLNLDNQLLKVARAVNQIIPIHRTGGVEPETIKWYGWYSDTYFDRIKDPERAPYEYGSESVSYSMEKDMNYFPGFFPAVTKRAVDEWEYHSMEFPVHQTYLGRTERYENFNDWAFASQLYNAVVIKYHTEVNRENKYAPTVSTLQYMFNDWWPSVNFGFTDHNLIEKIALSWMKTVFGPQLVATRVDHNIHSSGETIELPIHLLNDQYLDFAGAKVSWRIMEETDSFFMQGYGKPCLENRTPPRAPVTATIGHQIPVAEAAKGEFTMDLPPDSHVIAGTILFQAPTTKTPRHYTIYMTLTSADGKILNENWDHFVVVANAKLFKPGEGINPRPRFSLSLKLSQDGKALSGAEAVIADKFSSDLKYTAKLGDNGSAVIKDMLPGAYRLEVSGLSYEFLLNHDDKLEVNFAPGLKTTLGVKPIIAWPSKMGSTKYE